MRAGIRCCFPSVGATSLRPIPKKERGWDSHAFVVDGRWVFKVPRPPALAATVRYQQRLLRGLAALLPVRIPVLEFYSPRCRTLRAALSGAHLMAGQRLTPRTFISLGRDRQADLARMLAGCFDAIHRFPIAAARAAGARTTGRDAIAAEWRKMAPVVLPRLQAAERRWISALYLDHLDDRDFWRFRLRFVHGDLSGEHIFHQEGRLTGIIDWADSGIGDPAGDFGGLIVSYGEKFARQVLSSYHAPDEGLIRRPTEFYIRRVPMIHIWAGVKTGRGEICQDGFRRLRWAMKGKPAPLEA